MSSVPHIARLVQQVIDDSGRREDPERVGVETTQSMTRKLGLTSRTVRFYSEVGIATPIRRGMTRLFTPSQRRRLELARELRTLDVDVKSIADLLNRLSAPGSTHDKLDMLKQLLTAHVGHLQQQEKDNRQQLQVTERLARMLTGSASAGEV